jgi:predicted AlkP superfamily phosphohydrolase/phosphomutase
VLAVLVFDSVAPRRLERLLGEGKLPTLAELRERGQHHDLVAPSTHFPASTYVTLYSGEEPQDHGIYFPFQWDAREKRMRYMEHFPAPPAVWEDLAGRGLRSLVVDGYESRVPERFDGVMVNGWQFTNRTTLKPFSVPRGARRSLAGRFGRAPAADDLVGKPSVRHLLRFRPRLLSGPGRVADATVELLSRKRFDLAFLSFPSSHLAGHWFLDTSQVDVASVSAPDLSALESTLDDVYAAVDAAMGRIVRKLPSDADLIVLSPIGMDVEISKSDLLPEMLRRVLARDAGASSTQQAGNALWRVRRLPVGLRSAVASAMPDRLALELTARLSQLGADFSAARAFVVPGSGQSYIRLNLRGRERDGLVEEGDADALVEEIRDGLADFRDSSGRPAVTAVERTADVFGGGRRIEMLPDLVVHWGETPSVEVRHVESRRFGRVERIGVGSGRAGNHTDEAWALTVPGASSAGAIERPPRLADVATTVRELLGDGADAGQPLLRRA